METFMEGGEGSRATRREVLKGNEGTGGIGATHILGIGCSSYGGTLRGLLLRSRLARALHKGMHQGY